MKYSLLTPVLDAQITDIRGKIRLSMNGVVSEKMEKNGIVYKKNYGVSILRIKEIASTYIPNHDLAQRLWSLQIRETMIMATLLQPTEKFSIENAQEWVREFNQIEIIEQTCMNLFCKLPFANSLSCEWVQSNKIWVKITGFILAARITNKLDSGETILIIEKAIQASSETNLHLYKAIGLCLSRLCRKDKETATYILQKVDSFSDTATTGQKYISSEVKQEILFLDIL